MFQFSEKCIPAHSYLLDTCPTSRRGTISKGLDASVQFGTTRKFCLEKDWKKKILTGKRWFLLTYNCFEMIRIFPNDSKLEMKNFPANKRNSLFFLSIYRFSSVRAIFSVSNSQSQRNYLQLSFQLFRDYPKIRIQPFQPYIPEDLQTLSLSIVTLIHKMTSVARTAS